MKVNKITRRIYLSPALAITLSIIFNQAVFAEPNVSVSYYMDNRDYNNVTLAVSKKDMPHGFSIWGFTDFLSDQIDEDNREDFSRTFSEYRLSNNKISEWTGIKGLGLQVEYNDFIPGNKNTTWRGGITYQQKFYNKHWGQVRWHPLQSNQDTQVSIAYFIHLAQRLNLTGFADYNIRKDNDDQWVLEPQLNFRALENTWLLLEYRYNGFEKDKPNTDGDGWAIGVRYDL